MAEVDHNPQALGQPGSREPNKAHAAKPIDMHAHFMKKLGSEPELPPPGQESKAPVVEEQPKQEVDKTEQTSGAKSDEGGTEANQPNEADVEQESKYVTEFVDDDNNVVGYADADGNEYNVDGTAFVPEGDDVVTDKEQPGSTEEIGALQVDDRQYTADDVRKLNNQVQEYDADYRRKTSVMSRIRKEYEVSGREIEAVGSFFENIGEQNLRQYEQMDTKDMSPEQFSAYRSQYDQAKNGNVQLRQRIGKLREEVRTKRDKHMDDAAAESVEVLKRIEPRWNNEFYQKVRDFAVESGRYTPEEFSDVTDWRSMEGVVALMDAKVVQKIATGDTDELETKEPGKRKRRRQRQRQKRTTGGQFANKKEIVMQSPNARKDGSLREMFMAKLANERK